MSQFCYFAVANAVLASIFAIAVWLVSKWTRRPAVLHLLWVLVLLRLVMPPVLLFNIVGARDWIVASAHASSAEAVVVVRQTSLSHLRWLAVIQDAMQNSDILPVRSLIPNADDSVAVGEFIPARNALTLGQSCWQFVKNLGKSVARASDNLAALAVVVWLTGSAVCLLVQVFQVIAFRSRLTRISYSSRVWQARTQRVAARMGLRSCPEVWLVRAKISPMLWGLGRRTCVLFPERLLENLNARAQDTLLAHELAHYRRGDQWVRLIELTATVFFWWHPVLWWARQEIEKAEEICCDAWALKLANGSPRTYAEALLAAIDFVSSSLPPVACGASHGHLIRQRLEAIMCQRRVGNWFTPDAYPSVVGLALLVLLPCPGLWSKSSPASLKIPMAAAFATVGGHQEISAITDTSKLRSASSSDCIARNENGSCEVDLTSAQRALFRNCDLGTTIDLGVGVLSSACFSHNGKLLAVGTLQGRVDLMDCASGEIVRRIELSHTSVGSVAFSPDDSQLAIGTRDGLCKLLDLTGTGEEEIIRRERGASVDCVRFSKDGRFAAVLWSRRTAQRIELWDLVGGRVAATLRGQSSITSLTNSSRGDGKSWLVIHSDGKLSRWSVNEGLSAVMGEIRVSKAKLKHLRLSPVEDETRILPAAK